MPVITYDLNSEPIQYLIAKDQDLKQLFNATGPVKYTRWRDAFHFMIYTVLSQQISLTVADVMYGRMHQAVQGPLSPISLLKLSDDKLKSIGLSKAKTLYVKAVAQAALHGVFDEVLNTSMTDEAVKNRLLLIHGIGPWSVDMFMMFVLGHEDIFALGDLALRKALAQFKGVDPFDRHTLKRITDRYKPYRSIIAHALWQLHEA